MDKELKVEFECMQSCIEAINKLSKFYTNQGDSSDSVAQSYARKARARMIGWLVQFTLVHDGRFYLVKEMPKTG
jgi:hypothetical protein